MKNVLNMRVLFVISMIYLSGCNFFHEKSSSIGCADSSLTKLDSNVVRDVDGNIYKTIKIGDKIWMQENLKVTHYRNGDPIPNITDSTLWMNTKKGAYCNYNNDTNYVHIYGRLYNWYAVNDPRNICPVGWHVPSDSDYSQLDGLYGGTTLSGMALKESGLAHWKKPNPDATNLSGFTALPGGGRGDEGFNGFNRIGFYAFFWNKNEYIGDTFHEKNYAHECSLSSGASYFNQDWGCENRGMSVRCIKDNQEKK
jgi:uncharacterized protein (TIGR02145 family)